MLKIVHRVSDLDTYVTLVQTGHDKFSVVYGKQVKVGLTYTEAALEYGACIMHSAVCAGRVKEADHG
jgi:hypothetical protein